MGSSKILRQITGTLVVCHIAVCFLFCLGGGQGRLQDDTIMYWSEARGILDPSNYDLQPMGIPSGMPVPRVLLPSIPAFRPPLYQLFVAAAQSTFGSWSLITVVWIQHAMIVAASLLLAHVAWVESDRSEWAAIASLVMTLISISWHVVASRVLGESLSLLLIVVGLSVGGRWLRDGRQRFAIGFAVVCGLLTLTRVAFLIFPLPWLLARLFAGDELKSKLGMRIVSCVLLAALYCSFLVPWMVRNQLLHSRFMLTNHLGIQVFQSAFTPSCRAELNFVDDDNSRQVQAIAAHASANPKSAWRVYQLLISDGRSSVEATGLMNDVAWKAIKAQPMRYLQSVAERCAIYWSFIGDNFVKHWGFSVEEITLNGYSDGGMPTWRQKYAGYLVDGGLKYLWVGRQGTSLAQSLLAIASIVCLCTFVRTRPMAAVIGMEVFIVAAMTSVICEPLYRYRIVVEPLFILATAIAISKAISRWEAASTAIGSSTVSPPKASSKAQSTT